MNQDEKDILAQWIEKANHDLIDDFVDVDIKDLNQFAVRSRYPDQFISPELSVAKGYYQIAVEVKKMVRDKLKL